MIEVRLFASLRQDREKTQFFEASGFESAAGLLAALGIGKADVAILLINGRHSKPEDPVKDGDIIALFPPVGGG